MFFRLHIDSSLVRIHFQNLNKRLIEKPLGLHKDVSFLPHLCMINVAIFLL